MRGTRRIQKATEITDIERNQSLPEQGSTAAHHRRTRFVSERRMHSIEDAMDIALGHEIDHWERRRTPRDKKAA